MEKKCFYFHTTFTFVYPALGYLYPMEVGNCRRFGGACFRNLQVRSCVCSTHRSVITDFLFRGGSILKMEAEYSAETSAVHRISHSPSTQEHGQDRH
jgi:hypothetical protein